MCGIAGWIDFSRDLSNQRKILADMTHALISRGPDESGYWFSNNAAFGHRRLIVVEPEGGHQPMERQEGEYSYVLVYNGELYNTEELRTELLSKGHSFMDRSDTEVLLRSYIQWGESCVEHLNGIYAFAVWDAKKEQLFLARDRIGIKPLFYSIRKSSFLFASEIKSLLAHPEVSTAITADGLAEIFYMGPARTPGHGVFKDIAEIKPGCCMTVSRNCIKINKYWSLESNPHEEGLDKTIESVRDLVLDAVKRQLVSDVPLCTMLSGGLDSSIITAIAAELYRKEGKEPLRTFSVDYKDNDINFQGNEYQPDPDAPWVMKVAEHFGTRHHSFFLDTPQLAAALFDAVRARDLPGMTDIDSSLYLFSCEIKKQATVGLSGEGADEVFGGYPWFYRRELQSDSTFPWIRNFSNRISFYSKDLVGLINPEEYMREKFSEAINEVPGLISDTPEDSMAREMFYLNLTRWMPTLLDRKDRMSMAAGLELRVPFCDHRLVEYLWNIPWKYKYLNNREKGLLRAAMKELLPAEVLWRKKSPYPKTHNPDYLDTVRDWLLDIINDNSSPLLSYINKEKLEEFALSAGTDTYMPWFGQLMNTPQLLAYFIQVNYWLKEYRVYLV